MGLFNHFPYPDTHQLNLDWILDAVKNCVDKVTELWTYVREPGAGIQKALTDAQAAATTAQASAASAQTSATGAQASAARAQTSATSAQASAANARTSAIGAEANAANAQTSANDAQTSADDAQASADDAQASATTAKTDATSAQAAATTAQTAATSAQAAATTAQTSAQSAQVAATNAQDAVAYLASMMKTAMTNIYPVGYIYVNYRNQEMPVESDESVINRLQSTIGGTWARAGSHGQPVTEPDKFGWSNVVFGNSAGDANDFNFNIYVRTK
jgi:hypothetical protein